jgi:hypothetical protein
MGPFLPSCPEASGGRFALPTEAAHWYTSRTSMHAKAWRPLLPQCAADDTRADRYLNGVQYLGPGASARAISRNARGGQWEEDRMVVPRPSVA